MSSASETLTSEERKLGTTNIKPLFFTYVVTSLVGMILQMVASTADGFYVGNGIGQIGLATVGVIYPLWIIAISVGTLIGVGASAVVGLKLGEGAKEAARSRLDKASGTP